VSRPIFRPTQRMPPSSNDKPPGSTSESEETRTGLVARLNLFDATMVVMGGIVGAGIFMNPYVVARQVHTPALILFVWTLGGCVALAGAFVYAELAARLPRTGGQYAYLREAYHPAVAFAYGWALLLVIQTGGMAAVAITFARYFIELTHVPAAEGWIATAALLILTVVNCLGVRAGSVVQSTLMITKIVVIAALVWCGWLLAPPAPAGGGTLLDRPISFDLVAAIGAAMIPVIFAYGGWQTANFIADEVRAPARNLPRALLLGVAGVIILYLSVNFVDVRVLGAAGLAQTAVPASAVMRAALGDRGAGMIAAGIALSALGFLSQSILTAPRVYFAMARDGIFFKSVAWLHPRSRVPMVAIALQGFWAIAIALAGNYEQILNYFVAMDCLFFGLTATCIFVFRRRDARGIGLAKAPSYGYRVPGHPWTTGFFITACWLVVASTLYKYPTNSLIGLAIVTAGIPIYFMWGVRQIRNGNGI
jgi:APA family basic amino acid/polyamine antiporter